MRRVSSLKIRHGFVAERFRTSSCCHSEQHNRVVVVDAELVALMLGTARKAAVEHGWMQREVDSDEEEE